MTQVIRQVSSASVGRNRLTLQSVCRPDGIRALRPVWERKEGDSWIIMNGKPEFSPKYWVDVISKAATCGMLGSQSYKQLVVNLARGLDSSKQPTPKAYVKIEGTMALSFPQKYLEQLHTTIDELKIYDSLRSSGRSVSAYASRSPENIYTLRFEVSEEMHFNEAFKRLGDGLRKTAHDSSFEKALAQSPEDAFFALFARPDFAAAGLTEKGFAQDYTITVI